MSLHAWIEEDEEGGAGTGRYSVYGDENTWRYEEDLSLVDAWRLARSLDPGAPLKQRRIRRAPVLPPFSKKTRNAMRLEQMRRRGPSTKLVVTNLIGLADKRLSKG